MAFPSHREGDTSVLPDLPTQIPTDQPIGTVTADGACGTREGQSAIAERGATVIMPIRTSGRP